MYICLAYCISVPSAQGSQKTVSDSLEVELGATVWILGVEPKSSRINHGATSPALQEQDSFQ